MKRIFLPFLVFCAAMIFFAFGYPAKPVSVSGQLPESASVIDVPEDVQAILDKSCLPCHGPDGSGKPKMKWNWEKMPEMSTTKQISKLGKVAEKVAENKMPTAKFIKKHPEAKLSDEQKKILIDWADSTAEGLVSGN